MRLDTTGSTTSAVAAVPAATADVAHGHFIARLGVETDAADVAADLAAGAPPYTVVDVRGADAYRRAHIPDAVNAPSGGITAEVAAALPPGLLVIYCWGPGCNGAQKAGAALTGHGRQVKEMLGGFEYWIREGRPVEGDDADRLSALAEPDLVG